MLPFEKISKYFTLADLTRTSQGTPNSPTTDLEIANLKKIGILLDLIRDRVGPFTVTSAYRSLATQAAIKGGEDFAAKAAAMKSYHLRGMAADLVPTNMKLEDFWLKLYADKMIREEAGQIVIVPQEGIIHLSIADPPSFAKGTLMRAEDSGAYVRLDDDEVSAFLTRISGGLKYLLIASILLLGVGVYLKMKNLTVTQGLELLKKEAETKIKQLRGPSA